MTEINNLVQTIQKIVDAQSSKDWDEVNKDIPPKFHKDPVKYKSISGLFSPEEITKLPMTIEQDNLATPLEKLLYAALWKNGDILKITHIINGIKGIETPESSAMTFYYFGKFLANPQESPIIDQHVIRAFKAINLKTPLDMALLSEISKSGLLNSKNDEANVTAYIQWALVKAKLMDGDITVSLEKIDDVMFAFGRLLKSYSKN